MDRDTPTKSPSGLIAATFTPFSKTGTVDFDRIPEMVNRLIARGVSGLYVNGTTGEGPSLTSNERKELAEAYVGAAADRMPVIVQVGHNSLTEAQDLARHAANAGAHAISATPPGYFRAESVESLVEVVGQIATAAPDLPFYYYHIPAFGGVALDMAAFVEAAAKRHSNVRGIKFSSPNLHEFDRCRRAADGKLDVFFGVDEMLLAGLAMGARTGVGSTYNFAPELYLDLITAFEDGDMPLARTLQSQSIDMIEILISSCGRAGLKAAMSLSGIPCGSHRLPIRDPDSSALQEMEERLAQADLLKWIQKS